MGISKFLKRKWKIYIKCYYYSDWNSKENECKGERKEESWKVKMMRD